MSDPEQTGPAAGFVQAAVRDEFPGLRLDWITITSGDRATPAALAARLKALSDRFSGASVVSLRTKPVPQAFRAFFRQTGVDPDVTRIPSEAAAVQRLRQGGLPSAGLIADACLVALIETGVPVRALDADRIDARGLGIRTATAADLERADGPAAGLSVGSLVVADGTTVHAALFGAPAPGHGVGTRTSRATLFSVGVDGVPAIHVEEALWLCREWLR